MKKGKQLIVLLCFAIILCSLGLQNIAQAEVTEMNIALQAEMTTNSTVNSYPASNANDGSVSSRWAASGNGQGYWLQASWEDVKSIHKITLKEYQLSGDYRLQDFEIQVSENGDDWQTVATDTNVGAEKTIEFEPSVQTSMIRLYIVTASNGPHIAEFEIYERVDSPLNIPQIPTGLSAETGSNMVSLTWDEVEGVESYKIFRSENGSDFEEIGTSFVSGYIDYEVTNDTDYVYAVLSVNGAGESDMSESIPVSPEEPKIYSDELNLARQGTMSAHGYGGSYMPELANDGSLNSRWAGTSSINNWLQVNFEEPTTFSKIVLREFKLSDGYRTQKYEIQVSNDEDTWTTIAEGYGIGPGKMHEFSPTVTAKHIRLMILNSTGGAHIAEFEVYVQSIIPTWPEEDVLSATDITTSSLHLKWLPAQDDKGISEYKIYKDLEEFITLPSNQHEFLFTDLDSNTPYNFRIEAKNMDGNWTQTTPSLTIRTLKENYYFITFKDTPREATVKVKDTTSPEVSTDVQYQLSVLPEHGNVTLDTYGNFMYTPDVNFTGLDSFQVSGTDSMGETRSVRVTFYVQGSPPELDDPQYSSIVYPGEDGRLVYVPDTKGNIIPDFSNVGYMGGDEPIPDVPVVLTLEPAGLDDETARIQAAIDEVSVLPKDENGFRGALLLKKGIYKLENSLYIQTDGVVLRGEGQGEDGTVLLATAAKKYDLIHVVGSGSVTEIPGTRVQITDEYVPVGARTFTVEDAEQFSVGDPIIVYRPSTEEWIHAIGMDDIPTRSESVVQWQAGSYDFHYERTITAIDGNQITIDAPIVNALESIYGGGEIYKYEFPGRINKVGVENVRIESYYDESLGDQDELHGWTAIAIDKAEHAWVRNVTSRYFGFSTVSIQRGAKHVTVQDSEYLDGISKISGGRRYAFYIEGQLNLIRDVYSRSARHDFSFGSRVLGPNVFLNGIGENAYANSEPHHRWATGGLFDNISVKGPNAFVSAVNRGDSGSGHGWAGAQMVFWNSKAPMILVMDPPTARNYGIGMTGYEIDEEEFIPLIESNMDWIKARSGETFYYQGSPFIGNAYFEVTD